MLVLELLFDTSAETASCLFLASVTIYPGHLKTAFVAFLSKRDPSTNQADSNFQLERASLRCPDSMLERQ